MAAKRWRANIFLQTFFPECLRPYTMRKSQWHKIPRGGEGGGTGSPQTKKKQGNLLSFALFALYESDRQTEAFLYFLLVFVCSVSASICTFRISDCLLHAMCDWCSAGGGTDQ